MALEIVPITLKEANQFVLDHHRHHGPVTGHKFSIAASDGEKIVGVVIVSRPVSRHLDDGWTLEVTRLCTDGARNACSMLYAAAKQNISLLKMFSYHCRIVVILAEPITRIKGDGLRVGRHNLNVKMVFKAAHDSFH